MTDTDALWDDVHAALTLIPEVRGRIAREPNRDIRASLRLAAQIDAVLPIVEAEVRKAKAEALRETVRDMGEWAGEFILVTGDETDEDAWTSQTVGEWLEHRATEYETGDSDEHR